MWRAALWIKVLVMLGLLGWLASRIDFTSLLHQLSRGNVALLVFGTAVLAFQPVLGALRWQIILRRLGAHLPTAQLVRWTYTATLVNQVLPATVGGDGLRIWLAQRAGAPFVSVFNSVVLDRLLMLLALALLVLVSAPAFGPLIPARQLHMLTLLLAAGSVAGAAFVLAADFMPAALLRFRLARWFAALSRDTRALMLNFTWSPAIVALSLVSVANLVVSLGIFAFAFGARAAAMPMLLLLPPVIAASTLPVSIGGWGTREVAMVAAMGIVGVPSETAVLASVWLGLASIVVSLPGAYFYFFGRDAAVLAREAEERAAQKRAKSTGGVPAAGPAP